MTQHLAAHQHKTAQSEVLYALLVEGQGPLGSAFNADDFTNREVRDTDGDGLPEFIDAWGEPLPVLSVARPLPLRLAKRYLAVSTGGAPYQWCRRVPRAESPRPEPIARRPRLVVELLNGNYIFPYPPDPGDVT